MITFGCIASWISFFRGDCREKYSQHTTQLGGRRWIKLLLKRADFRGWGMSKEFGACVANIILRRDQMFAVAHYVKTNAAFQRNLIHYTTLTSTDFVAVALASGDCNSVRDLMRKKGIDIKVKTVLRSMDIANLAFVNLCKHCLVGRFSHVPRCAYLHLGTECTIFSLSNTKH